MTLLQRLRGLLTRVFTRPTAPDVSPASHDVAPLDTPLASELEPTIDENGLRSDLAASPRMGDLSDDTTVRLMSILDTAPTDDLRGAETMGRHGVVLAEAMRTLATRPSIAGALLVADRLHTISDDDPFLTELIDRVQSLNPDDIAEGATLLDTWVRDEARLEPYAIEHQRDLIAEHIRFEPPAGFAGYDY